MRSLNVEEMNTVAGGGGSCWCELARDFGRSITGGGIVGAYESAVNFTSYVIGRVKGDLHHSYYE